MHFEKKQAVLSIGGSKAAETVKRTSKTIRRKQTAHERISTGTAFYYFYVGRKGRVLFVLPVEDPGHDGRSTGRDYGRSSTRRIQKHVS